MVRLWQIETKQMQQAYNQVKRSGNPEVQGEIEDQKTDELERIRYVLWGDHEVIVDESIQDELDHPPKHPLQASLVNLVLFIIIISSAKCPIIYDGKEGKEDVRQKEKI